MSHNLVDFKLYELGKSTVLKLSEFIFHEIGKTGEKWLVVFMKLNIAENVLVFVT